MQTANLVTYLLMCVIAAATPGPGTISVISYSVNLGWKKTLPVILGIQVGMLAMAVLALSGLTAVLGASPVLFQTLQYLGAFYIAYLGYMSIRYSRTQISVQSGETRAERAQGFRHGALVTFASPKTLLFFSSFFSSVYRRQLRNHSSSRTSFGDRSSLHPTDTYRVCPWCRFCKRLAKATQLWLQYLRWFNIYWACSLYAVAGLKSVAM